MDMNEDYDKEEAELNADIAKMLGITPDESDTVETNENVIETEPEQTDTSEVDQEVSEPPKEETVELTRYKNLQAKMTQATQENAELKRSVAELQAQVNKLMQATPKVEESNDDDLAAVMNDYPEIAGPLAKKNKALEEKIARLEQALSSLDKKSESFSHIQQEIEKNKFDLKVKSVHPDLDEIVAPGHYDDLREWVEQQAPVIQQGFHSGNPDDAITVLSLYKQAKGLTVKEEDKSDKLNRAKAASTPNLPKGTSKPSSQKTTFTRDQIARMSMEEFMKYEAEIDEALRAGNIN